MFGICIYAWLLPSPAKHNLYPFKETGLSMYVATCLLPEKKKQIFGKDKYVVCVQDDCGGDVPAQEVEQLTQTRGFSLVIAVKSPGWGAYLSIHDAVVAPAYVHICYKHKNKSCNSGASRTQAMTERTWLFTVMEKT